MNTKSGKLKISSIPAATVTSYNIESSGLVSTTPTKPGTPREISSTPLTPSTNSTSDIQLNPHLQTSTMSTTYSPATTMINEQPTDGWTRPMTPLPDTTLNQAKIANNYDPIVGSSQRTKRRRRNRTTPHHDLAGGSIWKGDVLSQTARDRLLGAIAATASLWIIGVTIIAFSMVKKN